MENSGRRLTDANKDRLFANIALTHPDWKEDVKDLAGLLSYFVSYHAMPEKQILLETLTEHDISARRLTGLREIVSFIEAPSHCFNEGGDAASIHQRDQLIITDTSGKESIEGHNLRPLPIAVQSYSPETSSDATQLWLGSEDWANYESIDEFLNSSSSSEELQYFTTFYGTTVVPEIYNVI